MQDQENNKIFKTKNNAYFKEQNGEEEKENVNLCTEKYSSDNENVIISRGLLKWVHSIISFAQ